ncbi:hypothetical protein PENTCL1PPCAC_24172, partial [Pristionchus entomophagus]
AQPVVAVTTMFSLKDKIMFAVLAVLFLVFAVNLDILNKSSGGIPMPVWTMFAVVFAGPSLVITVNLDLTRILEWTIRKYSMVAGMLCSMAGSYALHLILKTEIVDRDWANLWMESVKAASILYLLPLYFAFLRWRIGEEEEKEGEDEEDDQEKEETEEDEEKEETEEDEGDSDLKMVLPGGIEVRIRLLEGSLASTVLGSAEIRRSLKYACAFYSLICCTIVAIAVVEAAFGMHAAVFYRCFFQRLR